MLQILWLCFLWTQCRNNWSHVTFYCCDWLSTLCMMSTTKALIVREMTLMVEQDHWQWNSSIGDCSNHVSISYRFWDRGYTTSNNSVPLKSGLWVIQEHWKWHNSIDLTQLLINLSFSRQNSKFWRFRELYSHISAPINMKFVKGKQTTGAVPNFKFIGATGPPPARQKTHLWTHASCPGGRPASKYL